MKVSGILTALAAMLATLAALACGGAATPAPDFVAGVTEQALPSVVHIITSSGSGTGFIVSENGLVVTNRHIVGSARQVTVLTATGEEYRGEVIQRHSVLDLAYVEIDSNRTFAPLAIGDSGDVSVGEAVIAIGYPLGEELGLEPTVSRGIISAKRDDYLQTDAALNPGNSGGPLLDVTGNVIGVITARVESTETGRPVTGIGFAIPVNAVRQDLGGLAASGSPSENATATPLPTIPPTPDVEATKAAIEAMDTHRRASEQATRAATEGQQEAKRYAASLEATRITELPTPTPEPTPVPTPLPTIPPTPDIEATKMAIAAMDALQHQSAQAARTAIEARQEAERYAASLEATRIAQMPTATPVPTPIYTPSPTPTTVQTLIPTPTRTATPVPTQTPIPRATPQSASRDYFTRGSSQDDVLHAQGTPTGINTYDYSGEEIWHYGFSTVTFSLPDGLVIEWRDKGNLRVELIPGTSASSTPGYFTRRSPQDDVLHAQGTPTEINTYNYSGEEIWHYGFSTVTFSLPDGLVIEWRDTGNLRVELIPGTSASSTPGYFTCRSPQDDVLHAQGTPTEINTYNYSGEEIWHYGFSTVTFSLPDGLVIEWRDTGNLNVK